MSPFALLVEVAGDAAHVHSAVGGPGLNLGLQDVVNLGWKLAAEVHGWAPPGLLDTYHDERHPVGRRVVMHTQAQAALLAPGGEVTALRALFAELLEHQENRRHIAELMAGSDIRYDMGGARPASHPLLGRPAPDLSLATDAGTVRLADLTHGARPLLLDLGGGDELDETAAGWKDRVDVVTATSRRRVPAGLLIRPDGYVAWAAPDEETGDPVSFGLREALATWFGDPA